MTPTATVPTSLHRLHHAGADCILFLFAVVAGLLLAAWAGGIAFEALVPPSSARG